MQGAQQSDVIFFRGDCTGAPESVRSERDRERPTGSSASIRMGSWTSDRAMATRLMFRRPEISGGAGAQLVLESDLSQGSRGFASSSSDGLIKKRRGVPPRPFSECARHDVLINRKTVDQIVTLLKSHRMWLRNSRRARPWVFVTSTPFTRMLPDATVRIR